MIHYFLMYALVGRVDTRIAEEARQIDARCLIFV